MARQRRKYSCLYPPCIHVVYDDRRKIYRVFIEDEFEGGETIVSTIPANHLRKACQELRMVEDLGYREADPQETDYLARKYLGVSKSLDEEEEW